MADPLTSLYEGLLRLKPGLRITAGVFSMIAGTCLTIYLWETGFLWGPTLFAAVAGIFLLVGGILDARKSDSRDALWRRVMPREAEILAGMQDAANQGQSPARYLNDEGIIDTDLRTYFLEKLKETPGAAAAPKPAPVRPGWRPPAPKRTI